MTVDPGNGQIYPAAYLDHFVPGVGNPAPGSLEASAPNFPGFFKSEGVFVAPRVGFAYDIFGNGRAALRGGFGVMNNERTQAGAIGNETFNPPTIFYPTEYYGNVSNLTTTQGVLSPSTTSILQYNARLPELFNMTLGFQQEVGFKTVLAWLQGRISVEMLYQESKWVLLIPFAKVEDLLMDVLTVSDSVNKESIRNSHAGNGVTDRAGTGQ